MRPATLLYLDIDGSVPKNLIERVTMCCRLWRWPIEAVRFDRTRRGWHVVVGINKRVAATSMVAAQAILGSDPMREAFNLARVRRVPVIWSHGKRLITPWNVLYSHHSRGVKL